MQTGGKNFEKLFLEAIEESLNVLGESGRQAVFFHLERGFSIKKQDIPKKPEAFIAGLEEMFGAGALVLEKLIIKNLYSKLGLKYKEKRYHTFAGYLKDLTVTLAQYPQNSKEGDEHSNSLLKDRSLGPSMQNSETATFRLFQ